MPSRAQIWEKRGFSPGGMHGRFSTQKTIPFLRRAPALKNHSLFRGWGCLRVGVLI